MKIEIFADANAAAKCAAAFIAAEASAAIAARGRFVLALSGGTAPLPMFRALAGEDIPWPHVHVTQTDERAAPIGHADRNLTHLRECLLEKVALPDDQVHSMPVELPDMATAAARYATTLSELAGSPVVLDLVHLGLGPDGHTASLVPGDEVIDVEDADVAITGVYQGRRRMTLTFAAINRARRILWFVTGEGKAGMLKRLRDADRTIPAGRVHQEQALAYIDRAAATML
jgi:6-phosphogluconolactonase